MTDYQGRVTRLATEELKPAASADNIAAIAGRGTIYITAAKLWFMVTGYGIHFILPRLITAEQFGMYQVVVSVVSIINAVIITGTYQTVSKHISEDERGAGSVKAKALKLQVLIGGSASLGFFLLAPVVSRYLNDDRLVGYLRLASLITLSYSFYAVFTGYLNGRRRFLAQASLDVAYSTLKMAFVVLFAWLGFGVAGGIGGFALAAATVLALSAIVAGRSERLKEVRAQDLLRFQSYLLLFTLAINLLQKTDLILVKALSSPDARLASENAGYYSAAINVANITYQVIISATFVIFPLISQATFTQDRPRTRDYISNTLRYTLMVMALVATLFSANARGVLSLVYPQDYQAGSAALGVVAYGMLLFGLLYVVTTIISAGGRPAVSLLVGLLTLAASAVLNGLLIPAHGLVGAAIGTTIAMLAGVVMSCAYLKVRFGALMSPLSVIRITVCAGLIYAAASFLPASSRLGVVIKLVALSLAYVAVLLVSGEIGREDFRLITRVFRPS
ncbi:MAG: oligosaccharide flippase family protein [Blastocatellia bacterium]